MLETLFRVDNTTSQCAGGQTPFGSFGFRLFLTRDHRRRIRDTGEKSAPLEERSRFSACDRGGTVYARSYIQSARVLAIASGVNFSSRNYFCKQSGAAFGNSDQV